MRESAATKQRLEIVEDEWRASRMDMARRVRVCATDGCDNLAMDRECCNHCVEEWNALCSNAAERELKRAARRERWESRFKAALEAWLIVWDWFEASELVNWALLIFVAFGVGYLCAAYSDAWVTWLSDLARS